jgi:hypothetical protein
MYCDLWANVPGIIMDFMCKMGERPLFFPSVSNLNVPTASIGFPDFASN